MLSPTAVTTVATRETSVASSTRHAHAMIQSAQSREQNDVKNIFVMRSGKSKENEFGHVKLFILNLGLNQKSSDPNHEKRTRPLRKSDFISRCFGNPATAPLAPISLSTTCPTHLWSDSADTVAVRPHWSRPDTPPRGPVCSPRPRATPCSRYRRSAAERRSRRRWPPSPARRDARDQSGSRHESRKLIQIRGWIKI